MRQGIVEPLLIHPLVVTVQFAPVAAEVAGEELIDLLQLELVAARLSRPAPDGEWRFIAGADVTPVRLVSRAPAADPRDGSFLAWFEAEDSATLTAGTPGRVTTNSTMRSTSAIGAKIVK